MKNVTLRSSGFVAVAAAALMMLAAPSAEARRGGWGGGGGWGQGGGWGHGGGWGRGHGRFGKGRRGKGPKIMRCMRRFMHAPTFMLKEKVGLSDQQIKKIEKFRDNFAQKKITYRAELARHRLVMRKLMQQDLPDANKVLAEMRKARNIRAKLQEERIKAGLWIMGTLTADQRKAFRKRCYMGPRGRFGKGPGFGRGFGRGRGMGGPGGGGGRGPAN